MFDLVDRRLNYFKDLFLSSLLLYKQRDVFIASIWLSKSLHIGLIDTHATTNEISIPTYCDVKLCTYSSYASKCKKKQYVDNRHKYIYMQTMKIHNTYSVHYETQETVTMKHKKIQQIVCHYVCVVNVIET